MTSSPAVEGPAPAPKLMDWPPQHYGCRIVELGEEGDAFAVAGPDPLAHVSDRRALAVVLAEVRSSEWIDRDDRRGLTVGKVTRRWVTYHPGDAEEPWQWSDALEAGSTAITYVEVDW